MSNDNVFASGYMPGPQARQDLRNPKIREWIGQAVHVMAEQHLDQRGWLGMSHHSQVRTFLDEASRSLVIMLDTHLKGVETERIRHSVHEEWPASWWDAFKDRWFPAWMLKRWPVEYERFDLEIDEQKFGGLCPHIVTKDNMPHFRFMTHEYHGFHRRCEKCGREWRPEDEFTEEERHLFEAMKFHVPPSVMRNLQQEAVHAVREAREKAKGR